MSTLQFKSDDTRHGIVTEGSFDQSAEGTIKGRTGSTCNRRERDYSLIRLTSRL